MESNVVYIGRRSHKEKDALFGNPVKIGGDCPFCKELHNTAASTLPCYRKYLWKRLNEEEEFYDAVKGLDGKKLFCPGCSPFNEQWCHGTILKKAIAWIKQKDNK